MPSEKDKIEIRHRYAALELTADELNAIEDCWMQGINKDGAVWVTWTDVQRLILDLKEIE